MREAPENAAVSSGWYLDVGLIVVLAAAVRVYAAQDEFWFDEIWSLLAFARGADSPLDTFTQHHDNNHYLTTLWMIACGPENKHWVWYRIPSIVAGVATVPLAARFALRWGRVESIVTALLAAASYVLIVYASEARGYALAGCFALVALLALERSFATRSRGANALFVVATLLGILAHLSTITFYAGAVAWSVVVLIKGGTSAAKTVVELARLHTVPCVALVLIYWFDVREMIIGGGEGYVLSDVLLRTAALAIGSFATQPFALVASALLAACLAVVVLVRLYLAGDDVWVFLFVAVFVAPAAILLVRETPVLYERYFYLGLLLYLPMLGYLLGWLWRVPRAGRWLSGAALVAIVLGNATLSYEFLRVGRGGYYRAVQYMAEHSVEPEIGVASDNPFDCKLYLAFYGQYLRGDRRLSFHEQTRDLPASPEWIISCNHARPFSPARIVTNSERAARERYVLVQEYPCARLSGYNYALYQREDLANRSAVR